MVNLCVRHALRLVRIGLRVAQEKMISDQPEVLVVMVKVRHTIVFAHVVQVLVRAKSGCLCVAALHAVGRNHSTQAAQHQSCCDEPQGTH